MNLNTFKISQMLFANFEELSSKGITGNIFYWIRFVLCAFPIGSVIICACWAAKTASKNWSTIVNNTILILCIIIILFSIASFVFILFATLSILRKLETIFTYLYFFITIIAFIISFVLLSFGNSSHEIDYLSKFDKACGNSKDAILTFPTPAPTPTPMQTPTKSPQPSSTPIPTPIQTSIPSNQFILLHKLQIRKQLLDESLAPTLYPTLTPLPTPSSTPVATARPKNFSESDFCLNHWTSWSRKKYIRLRTTELKNAYAGIISPWVILFFIEFFLLQVLKPSKFLSGLGKKKNNDENNALLDENLLPDQQSLTQDNDENNIHLGMDPIFRDEDDSGGGDAQTDSNI